MVDALTLAACGSSDKASEAGSAENVEMPAEEAVSGIEEGATPAADASATATTGASEAAAAPSAAVEAAAAAAEKKM